MKLYVTSQSNDETLHQYLRWRQ